MQIEFEILGKAKAKQSFKIGRNGFKYTPADVKSYANWVRLSFMQKYPKHLPSVFHETPLMVEIDVDVQIPKSFSKKKQELARGGMIRPQTRPDVDNYSKALLDSMNGLVFPDDKQIVSLTVRKWYSDIEKVTIRISEI